MYKQEARVDELAEELMLQARLISAGDLEHVHECSHRYGQDVEKVLSVLKIVSDEEIESIELARNMVRDGQLSWDVAVDTLINSRRSDERFQDAVLKTTSSGALDYTQEMKKLLVASRLASTDSIKEAGATFTGKRLTLCEALIEAETVCFTHITNALECLHLIGQGRISRTTAIAALRNIKQRDIDLATAIEEQGLTSSKTLTRIRTGDLLMSGQADTGEAEKKSLPNCPTAMLVVEKDLISKQLLGEMLHLQKLCHSGLIDRQTAGDLIRRAIASQRDVDDLILEEGVFSQEDAEIGPIALRLLIEANLVRRDWVLQVKERYLRYGMSTLKALVASEVISPELYEATLQCIHYMKKNNASEEKVIKALSCAKLFRYDSRSFLTEQLNRAESDQQSSASWKREALCMGTMVMLSLCALTAVNFLIPLELREVSLAATVVFSGLIMATVEFKIAGSLAEGAST